jgi:agmatinase
VKVSERVDELVRILRPAGGGVYVVSTGLEAQRALQRRIYEVTHDAAVEHAWRVALERLDEARVVVLGVPSDCGAGFVRGANQGPAALRDALLSRPDTPYLADGVTDVGDVRVVPQLLTDAMLSEAQKAATRRALYGDAETALPVAPLDLCRLALTHVAALAPNAVPIVLGGDHSVSWPAFAAAHARGRRLGLLHFDAHTDLLPERLGIEHCFATWAYHANELLGRDGRLVQVGIRASGRTKEHWESTLGVRQYWPDELHTRSLEAIADDIIERFRARGVQAVYVSNDIDGTDERYVSATGTPAPDGPSPQQVRWLTRRVLKAFPLAGGDVVEVAPPLGQGDPHEPERTLHVAADYLDDLLSAGLSAGEG